MKKKTVSIFTLLFFVFFCVSCTSTKKLKIEKETDLPKESAAILGVQKKSGEYIEFVKAGRGRIEGGFIQGLIDNKFLELNRADFKYTEQHWENGIKKYSMIKTNDGKTYKVLAAEEKENSIRFHIQLISPELISVPHAEVELLWTIKDAPLKTLVVVLGGAALVVGAGMGLVALLKESCPFIYSFDGREYVFDAEPYGGATCPGMQRTEWCNLEHLRPVAGKYRIKITNEVDETQRTDEVKLLAVDHAPGMLVAADEAGVMHTFARPRPPDQAYDREGNSITGRVVADDRLFWVTPEDALDPETRNSMKDELTFEFTKPDGAQAAKLLFNGCNTLWASQMLRRFLELRGSEVGDYYRVLNQRGPVYQALMDWNLNAELYRLQLLVETSSGWRAKGSLVGGGPFASENKAYMLDIRDVPGNVLKIRLTPPAGFWMINHIAVDYSGDAPVQVAELTVVQGMDSQGQDALGLLDKTDGRYLDMPEIGNEALLVFEAPPLKKGLERSVVIKASGYYDIHLRAEGECQQGILSRFIVNPDAAIEFSLREYQKWRRESTDKAAGVE
jgi:hypothetical protein